jgi:hypothetical protein
MAIILKIKFDPLRGGGTAYDFITPALRVDNWSDPVFSLLESTDDHIYTPLNEGSEWRADIDWNNSRLRVHILKDYSSIIYLMLASASARNITAACSIEGELNKNIPAAYIIEAPLRRLIPVSWNTGAPLRRNIPTAYHIESPRGLNIPVAYNQKNIRARNIPTAYGVSGAVGKLINVSFHIGSLNSQIISAAVWIMGIAHLPASTVILPDATDPAASRVKGRTKELILSGSEWEDLD